jgi:hypothetical protein
MRRRQFLASGTALLSVGLAGCAHPSVVLDLNEATADDVADEVSTTVEAGSEEHDILTSARENGSATGRSRRERFDGTGTVRLGDAFYDVTETRIGSSEVTVYEVRVDVDPADPTPERGEIDYGALPETDRRRLDPILSGDGPSDQEGYDVGVGYGTAEEVGNDSVFVPDQRYDVVVRDGERYRVAVDSRTVTEAEYRYEVTEVAPDVEAFADRVRERYLFALSGLSDAEREVVEEAIDGAYFEDDDAFRSVVDRIRDHDGIEVEEFYGTWLLTYEGAEYVTYVEW